MSVNEYQFINKHSLDCKVLYLLRKIIDHNQQVIIMIQIFL